MLTCQIIQYANQLRENMGIRKDEVIGDILEVITLTGYKYMENSFGNDFSGFCQSLGHGDYLIGFNRDHYWSEKFRRFTLSHELGHVSIPAHRKVLDTDGSHHSVSEFMSGKTIEREADEFAINFLASKNLFQSKIKSRDFSKETILYLSDFFQISSYAAALRFVELTDFSCGLIVCNSNGYIRYEKRSDPLYQSFKHQFLSKQKVSNATLTYEYINARAREDECIVSLNEWYQDLPVEVKATESVIPLGYNGLFLTLLTPHVDDIDEYIEESKFQY